MLVISRRSSDPSGMAWPKLTVRELPAGTASPVTSMRLRPSRAVMRVVEPSKVEPSGRVSVTEVTSSPGSTVPSQVRRVSIPPMTPSPPSSLGRAVAFSVVSACAGCGAASVVAKTPVSARARATRSAPRLCCMLPPFRAVQRGLSVGDWLLLAGFTCKKVPVPN